MLRTVVGSFLAGETEKVSEYPSIKGSDGAAFSTLEGGYLGDKGSFYIRSKFKTVLSKVTKVEGFKSARIFAYNSINIFTGHADRAIVMQFNSTFQNASGSLATEVYYTHINLDTGLILQNNARFFPGYTFFDEHFDIIAVRSSPAEESDTARTFYVLGGSALLRFTMDDATGVVITSTTRFNVSHPYLNAIVGAQLFFICWAVNTTQTSSTFINARAFGTKFVLANLPLGRKSSDNAGDLLNATVLVSSIGINERLLAAEVFANTIVIITSIGLNVHYITPDAVITGTGVYQRKVASFPGKSVRPVSVQGQFLYYFGDSMRVRDVSSMEASIQLAGDYEANDTAEPFTAIASGIMFGEDTALLLSSTKREIKTAAVFITPPFIPSHKFTTLYTSSVDMLDLFAKTYINWFILQESGVDELEILEYNAFSTAGTYEASVKVLMETIECPLISDFKKLKLHIKTGGEEFVEIPGQMFDHRRDEIATISTADADNVGDTYYSPATRIEFSTTGSMVVKSYVLSFSEQEGFL